MNFGLDRAYCSGLEWNAYWSRPWTKVGRGQGCIVYQSGPWTEVVYSGLWTAVNQSEPVYRGLIFMSRTCLNPPKFIVPGKARPLKIAPEAIHTSSFTILFIFQQANLNLLLFMSKNFCQILYEPA